jgi:hypothetical protein
MYLRCALQRVSVVCSAALGVACTAPVVDDVADAQGAMTQGIVVVESSFEGDTTETNVSAKFMRMSASADPDLAERIIGSRFELPAPGACVPATHANNEVALTQTTSIELLDVGDLTLQAGRSEAVPLAARAFPDVGDLVSGVFYVSPEPAYDFTGAATYVLQSTGSAMIDGFSITSEAPAAPEEVWIEDDPITSGLWLEADTPVTLRWEAPEDAASRRNDRVVIDVTPISGTTMRCAFADVGEGTIPASLFAERAVGTLPAALTLRFHRIRQVSFGSRTIHAGEVRFDLSLVARATVFAPQADEPEEAATAASE